MTLAPAGEPSGSLPTPTQTLLLRSVLHAGDSARDAWRQWVEGGGPVEQALQGLDRRWIKRLLPLLWVSVARHQLTADAKLQTFLKLAYTAEAVRNAFCRREGRAVLRRLTEEGLAPVVLRGLAFSETVYDEPCLRHFHDLDLFVANDDACRAPMALAHLGFAAHSESHGRLSCVHPSGLQVTLHGSLFPAGLDARLEADALKRCERETIAGVSSLVLAPADALLHACAHAWGPAGFPSPMWICDLWLLLGRRPDADWTTVAGSADRACLAKPLALTIEYLATDLEAPIPPAIRPGGRTSSCRS